MFIVVSVCLSVCPPGVGCSYMTTTHDALDRVRTVQGLPPLPEMVKLVQLGPHSSGSSGQVGGGGGARNMKSMRLLSTAIFGSATASLCRAPSPGHVQTCSLGSTDGWQPTGMLSCYFFHSLDWFMKTDHLFHYVTHNNLFT